jgi:NAD(P)-dependent dehydrogenase (short-subunit alcohol dehydrogenase family)
VTGTALLALLFFVGDGSISARGSRRTHLSAAKMGLIGMARGLASEFAPHNIRVNVVSPGSIRYAARIRSGIRVASRTPPASRSAGKAASTRSPRPACS